jgi:transcriptional regulator
VSVIQLLLGGILPGLLCVLMLMLMTGWLAVRRGYPRTERWPTRADLWRDLKPAFPAIVAPLILIAGMLAGFFTPTEIASVTVLYAMLISSLFYRELTWKGVLDAAFDGQFPENGSFVTKIRKGRKYWYYEGYETTSGGATEARKYSKYVGSQDDPEIAKRVEAFGRTKASFRERRSLVMTPNAAQHFEPTLSPDQKRVAVDVFEPRPSKQHGFGLAKRILQVSNGLLTLNQGTLYPALLRLEQRRWIKSRWGVSENNRKAKFYELTARGRRQIHEETKSWELTVALMARFLAKPAGDR